MHVWQNTIFRDIFRIRNFGLTFSFVPAVFDVASIAVFVAISVAIVFAVVVTVGPVVGFVVVVVVVVVVFGLVVSAVVVVVVVVGLARVVFCGGTHVSFDVIRGIGVAWEVDGVSG